MNNIKVSVDKDGIANYYGYKIDLVKLNQKWHYSIEGFNLSDNAGNFDSRKEALEDAIKVAREDLHSDY